MCSFLCAWVNTSGDMAMALIKPVSPVPYVKPNKKDCLHPWWQSYPSRHIRICGECGEERKLFDLDIQHQR
jgi:hypothetical protein